jgi:hypothetical protein
MKSCKVCLCYVYLSICPSACNSLSCMKSDTGEFSKKLSTHFQFWISCDGNNKHHTWRPACFSMGISSVTWYLSKWRNVLNESCIEKWNHFISFTVYLFYGFSLDYKGTNILYVLFLTYTFFYCPSEHNNYQQLIYITCANGFIRGTILLLVLAHRAIIR